MWITRSGAAKLCILVPMADMNTDLQTNPDWPRVAGAQDGMISRRQLRACSMTADRVHTQLVARRWAVRSGTVLSTFTGTPTVRQLCWLGVLHGGGNSLVGGRTVAQLHGLKRWDGHDVTVLVDHRRTLEPVEGIRFVRTRRPLRLLLASTSPLPMCQLEPAVLLVAAYEVSPRAGQGLIAATVQQGLTTVARLEHWLGELRPLHRAPLFRETLAGISGGAQSVGELDINRVCRDFVLPLPTRQVKRRDAAGRLRFTDCEWDLPGGYVAVLEIDGGFHMLVEHWEDDMVRERGLVDPKRMVLRCTTRELRDDPRPVVSDLRRLGVGRAGVTSQDRLVG